MLAFKKQYTCAIQNQVGRCLRALYSINFHNEKMVTTIAPTTDNIEKIHQMVLDDYWIKLRNIAEAVGITKKRVYYMWLPNGHTILETFM